MKQFKLATAIFISFSLLSSTTFAQKPMKDEVWKDQAPMAVSAPHNWNGFYAGLNAGVVKHTMNITDNQAATFRATINQTSNPQFSGGFQVGYRHELDFMKVSGLYGVELSSNFSNATSNQTYGGSSAPYSLESDIALKNVTLLQLIGGIAADKALLFLAAGMSWVNITGTVTDTDTVPFFNSFNVGKKAFGSALGGGIEYAFNEKFSARLKVDVVTPNTYSTSDDAGNTYQISNNIVQTTLGVNYKFA